MTLYVTEQGAGLYRRGGQLQVRKGKNLLASAHLFDIKQVVLFGQVSLSAPVVGLLLSQGIDTVLLSAQGQYRGRLIGPQKRNILLRQQQFRRYEQEQFRLQVAKKIVEGKLRNMRALLMRWSRRRGMDISTTAHRLRYHIQALGTADRVDSVRGLEGAGTAAYFGTLGAFMPEELGFKGRNRRPPKDPANALLSFGYALLANSIEGAVYTVGLDPYVGFLHVVDYGRASLVLDMMEEFRPVLVDAVVLDLAGHGMVHQDCFEQVKGGVYLNSEGRRLLIDRYQKRLEDQISYAAGGERIEKITYRRCLEYQCRGLVQCIMGQRDLYRPYLVR